MRILYIIPAYKPAYIYGGTTVVVGRLAEEMAEIGNDVTVYTTTANGKEELPVTPGKEIVINKVKVIYFKRCTKDHTHVSFKLWRRLWHTIGNYDIIHIHSWWSFLILGVAWICRLKGVKPIISPHGMLSSYSFGSQNSLKKKLLHSLIANPLLKHSYLHVSTNFEWRESLQVNPEWRGFTASNIFDLPEIDGLINQKTNDVFTISFISRIDPKKGLDILFRAMAKITLPYILQVGGSGDNKYIDELKALAKELGILKNIAWSGWKDGNEKFQFFADSDLFILTSLNENFGIVVLEALSLGTPVLLSDHVGLADYVKSKELGWVAPLNEDQIASAILKAYNNRVIRERIRKEAPEIIRDDFNPKKIARLYHNYYDSLK